MNLTLPDFMDYIKKTAMDERPAVVLKVPMKYILMIALEKVDINEMLEDILGNRKKEKEEARREMMKKYKF